MGQDVLGGTNKSDLDHTFGFILPAQRERLNFAFAGGGTAELAEERSCHEKRWAGACNPSLSFAFCMQIASELPQ
jgi:hypothetical protein